MEPSSESATLPHVFVLGTTRSGTSALQLSILESTRYAGYGEGHVLSLLPSLLQHVEAYVSTHPAFAQSGTTASRLSLDDFRESQYCAFRCLYSKVFGERPFADKTPSVEAIRVAPQLSKIWPGCRVIHCQRRAIENVQSKIKKFPGVGFEQHCLEWRDCMIEWSASRRLMDNCLEFDQIDLQENPEETSARIGSYLGLASDEIERIGKYLAGHRPERSRTTDAHVDLNDTGWSEEQRRIFVDICGDVMADNGYTLDARYRV